MKNMKKSKLPKGWDEEKVRRVISCYEQQTEDEAVAEDEAAFGGQRETVIEVPKELLPVIHELIAKRRAAKNKSEQ
jgi:hypothetical protein